MKSWDYEENDVLLIFYKDQEQVARIASFVDCLDNTTPLYVNVRVSDGLRWGERTVKIQPEQIIKPLPDWYREQQAAFDACIKETVDRVYARMSQEEVAQRRKRRSPLDIMIDRACGLD